MLFQLVPQYQPRLWGGQRLQANPQNPIGEAWVVYEGNQIANGPYAGRTLAEAAIEMGADLLGPEVLARTGTRFPLLIKLLDCADWLSVQVHPNDEQAKRLEGPQHFGKTEAWHILQADAGAKIIAGVQPGTSPDALAVAIRNGTILERVQYHPVQSGDTVYMPAGTIHALGPGILLYEVQQTSDITYRVFDWDRPAAAGRALHLEQSVAVSDPDATGQLSHLPSPLTADHHPLIACPYFTLELLLSHGQPLTLNTRGASFHILTVIEGQAEIESAGERLNLGRFETGLVPARAGEYHLRSRDGFKALKASVEIAPTA